MLSLARTQGTSANTQMALTWTLPLGPERPGQSVSLSHNRSRYAAQENSAQSVATYQKNVPVAEGYGYQLEARDSGDARGALGYQNRFGSYQLEAAHANGEQAGRASVRGGLAYAGQQVYASRWISDSFGLARVPGFPGVRVYADNQWVGTTDANGNALLPRLRAYQRNPVRLEPRDLPLNAQVDTLMLEVVPFYRSAALADFPVRLANGAQFQVLLASGEPLPAGSTVQLMGAKQPFPVGFDGVVYVTGLSAHNTLQARWQTQSCTFELAFAASADALPDLGSVLCTGVTP
jgi:outer membrane usher protein